MAETIGSWAIKLSANASGMVKGLDEAVKKSQLTAQQLAMHAKTATSATNSLVAQVTRVDFSAQTAQLQGLAGAAAGIVGAVATGGATAIAGAVAAAGSALISFASASMDAVAVQAKLGRQIGITAQEAAGLQVMAARAEVNTDTLNHSLQMWPLQLAHLRQELNSGHGGPMTAALGRLGISAREFASASLPEQLARIAEGSTQITNPMEKNAMMMQLLGRHARELMPLFRQPANELRNLGRVAEDAGYSISQPEAELITDTVKFMKELGAQTGAFFSNIGQGAAVMFAPVAKFASETLGMVLREARPLVQLLGHASGIVVIPATVVAGIAGAVRLFMPVLSGFGAIVKSIGAGARDALLSVKPAAMELWNIVSGAFGGGNPIEMLGGIMKQFAPVLGDALRKIGDGLAWLVERTTPLVRQVSDLYATLEAMNQRAQSWASGQQGSGGKSLGTMFAAWLASASVTVAFGANAGQVAGSTVTSALQTSAPAAFVGPIAAPGTLPDVASGMAANWSQQAAAVRQQLESLGLSREQAEILEVQRQLLAGASVEERIRVQQQVTYLQQLQRERLEREAEVDAIREMTRASDMVQQLTLGTREFERQRMLANGVHASIVNTVTELQDMAERLQEINRMGERAQQVFEQTRNPVEVFRARVEDLNWMREAGRLTDQTYERGIAQAFQQLSAQANERQPGAPAAALRGSVEEQRMIADAQRAQWQQRVDPVERLRQIAARQEQLQQQQQRDMAELVRRARDGFVGIVE